MNNNSLHTAVRGFQPVFENRHDSAREAGRWRQTVCFMVAFSLLSQTVYRLYSIKLWIRDLYAAKVIEEQWVFVTTRTERFKQWRILSLTQDCSTLLNSFWALMLFWYRLGQASRSIYTLLNSFWPLRLFWCRLGQVSRDIINMILTGSGRADKSFLWIYKWSNTFPCSFVPVWQYDVTTNSPWETGTLNLISVAV